MPAEPYHLLLLLLVVVFSAVQHTEPSCQSTVSAAQAL
jgi:hypothetical protein